MGTDLITGPYKALDSSINESPEHYVPPLLGRKLRGIVYEHGSRPSLNTKSAASLAHKVRISELQF